MQLADNRKNEWRIIEDVIDDSKGGREREREVEWMGRKNVNSLHLGGGSCMID